MSTRSTQVSGERERECEHTIIKEGILKGRGESHANLSLSSKLAQGWLFSAYALLTKKKAKKRESFLQNMESLHEDFKYRFYLHLPF